ncbi:MAG: 23S rRNA (adenine(2503)-C(2))-methyltransferase RlmN [Candidatus Omnitrophica bacterium]|nr:23S rRNA (adenine(2503)-C(2))-methyltransferase RlmN [Candidatus Omnitrophota bacterium]
MALKNILDCSYEDLVTQLASFQEKPFRATQIFEWIYQKNISSFEQMKNLPPRLKEYLKTEFVLELPACRCEQESYDGTKKILFELSDREHIETVIIPTKSRVTVCVSTQVGCKYGCRFCASGLGGFKRHLSCAEILGQICFVKRSLKNQDLSHIVFMGVGEPLDNYENLMKAIRILNASEGFNIGARRITISTCGLIPQIKKLTQEGLQIELSISLHGATDALRNELMPVNQRFPLLKLVEACHDYVKATNRQITFEYILIKDLTCTLESARRLKELLKGLLCKLNLIVYNEVSEFPYKSPSKEEVRNFQAALDRFGIHATLRQPRGRDIAAACGQLRHQHQ